MAVNARWRLDPRTGNPNPLLITAEEHTIEYHPEPNRYGFYLDEAIQLRNPSTIQVVTDDTAAIVFTEVAKTAPVSEGEFWADYDASGYLNTGFVECNAADNGKAVLVTYHGLGTIDHPTFRKIRDFNYNGNVNIQSGLNVTGPTTLQDLKLSLGINIDEFSTDGTLSGNSDSAVPTEKAVKSYNSQNLLPGILKNYDSDLVLSGSSLTQRTIFCKNFHVTASTNLSARHIFVDGDMTLDSGVILTLSPLKATDGGAAASAGVNSDFFNKFDAGKGGAAGSGAGAGNAGGGSGGFGGLGGATAGSVFQNGGLGFYFGGGLGGYIAGATTYRNGGSYPGAGGSGGDGTGAGSGGAGGIVVIVSYGSFTNSGSIEAKGGNGGAGSGANSPVGGTGGPLCYFIVRGNINIGSGAKITANATAGGTTSGAVGGSGGGGGHVEIYAPTSTFGTITITGGTAGSGSPSGNAGDNGTSLLIDISSDKTAALGGARSASITASGFPSNGWSSDQAAGHLFRFMERPL